MLVAEKYQGDLIEDDKVGKQQKEQNSIHLVFENIKVKSCTENQICLVQDGNQNGDSFVNGALNLWVP